MASSFPEEAQTAARQEGKSSLARCLGQPIRHCPQKLHRHREWCMGPFPVSSHEDDITRERRWAAGWVMGIDKEKDKRINQARWGNSPIRWQPRRKGMWMRSLLRWVTFCCCLIWRITQESLLSESVAGLASCITNSYKLLVVTNSLILSKRGLLWNDAMWNWVPGSCFHV